MSGDDPRMNGREIIAYLRVSTHLQGLDGYGIAAQRDAVDRFARGFGCAIVAEYAEVETGRKDHLRNRPQLLRAVAHAKRSKALLVIARLDRLARSVLVTSQLLESNVEFVACDNPHANRLTIQILAAMAEHEGRLISERTKAGLAAARARGVVFPPGRGFTLEEMRRGQRASAIERKRVTAECYADLVPIVRDLRDQGKALTAVAEALNALGQRTQRGNAWDASGVQRFLKREGLPPLPPALRYNKEVADDIRRRGVAASRAAFAARTAVADAPALPIVRAMIAVGATRPAIVAALNERGLCNSEGSPWATGPVLRMLRRAGLADPVKHRVNVVPSAALQRRRERARETSAPYLTLIRRLRVAGHSYPKIATTLNECGYVPPRSDRWTGTTVYQLLLRQRRWAIE